MKSPPPLVKGKTNKVPLCKGGFRGILYTKLCIVLSLQVSGYAKAP
jgi:hypothetical protein